MNKIEKTLIKQILKAQEQAKEAITSLVNYRFNKIEEEYKSGTWKMIINYRDEITNNAYILQMAVINLSYKNDDFIDVLSELIDKHVPELDNNLFSSYDKRLQRIIDEIDEYIEKEEEEEEEEEVE